MSVRKKESEPRVKAVCLSEKTGMKKKKVEKGLFVENLGLKNDAHANSKTHRQVSLLAMESIKKMQDMGLNVSEGDFAENITTEYVDLLSLKIGTKIKVGHDAVLEITQHGKICHKPCEIYRQAGTCIMPEEGIFARVIRGGTVKEGDKITIMDNS